MTARVRRHVDLRVGQHWTDAEIQEQLNVHLADLYDKLVNAHGERYFEKATPTTVTTIAGTAGYSLPADFFKMSRFCALVNGREYPLDRFTDAEVDGTRPVSRAMTLNLYYVPTCPILASGASTFDGINGWEEYPILLTAIDYKQASEQDPSGLYALLDIQNQRLSKITRPRDKAQAYRMTDVTGRSRNDRYNWLTDATGELPRYQLRATDVELRDGF